MNKKKVKELIEKAISELNTTDMGILYTQSILEEVLEELSKSDWNSVEDRLPEFGERVNVCNKDDIDDIWTTFRTQEPLVDKTKLGFAFRYGHMDITHWKPIEKLEE